ncbi:MAG TPA: hypothetical protein VJS64_18430 [Pyrinomonadaceae bacterium]|nr:hypothetical protein [Pyrinomonadaceae bacterium]
MEKPASPEYKTPEHYEPRVTGTDPKTGQPITYDHKPRVEVVDAKAGKYAFKWIGFDGLEKTATFYRVDAVDVLVSASVVKLLPDHYQYTYEVKNLPSSGTYLKRFIIQTFAADVRQAYGGEFWGGLMSKDIKAYSEGTWIDFADVSDHVQINPGQSVTIQFTSAGPPGLVESRAGAESEVESADEDMPGDLAPVLGGYGEYLHGWTIGPVDELKSFSPAEKTKYLLDKLPQFRKIGWMTDEAFNRYEQRLKNGDLNAISARIDEDLKTEQITSEVFAIVQAMK